MAKYGQAIISFGATAFQIWTSLKVIESLSIGKTGSNAASGVPLGRALSRATPYLIGISAGISVAESIASGYSAEAAKSRERSKKKNEDKITSAKSFYDQTGIYSSDAESLGCVVNRFVLYYANVKKGCRENGECIRTT